MCFQFVKEDFHLQNINERCQFSLKFLVSYTLTSFCKHIHVAMRYKGWGYHLQQQFSCKILVTITNENFN